MFRDFQARDSKIDENVVQWFVKPTDFMQVAFLNN
jgi:hypothetical protein